MAITLTSGKLLNHQLYGPLREVDWTAAPRVEKNRINAFRLYVTEVLSGPEEWMLFHLEYDEDTHKVTVLDHRLKPVSQEVFLAARTRERGAA